MGFAKEDREKEYVCKQCMVFLDIEELYEGKCPDCGMDEHVHINEWEEED